MFCSPFDGECGPIFPFLLCAFLDTQLTTPSFALYTSLFSLGGDAGGAAAPAAKEKEESSEEESEADMGFSLFD